MSGLEGGPAQGLLRAVRALEELRRRRVLVLAATTLRLDLLDPLYEVLRRAPPAEQLDVVFYTRGGEVTAARRLALLLRDFGRRLTFLVAHRCESAGTIMALAANEIVAGPVAMFTPVDPTLEGEPGGSVSAVAAQDVRHFRAMAERWFGVPPAEAGPKALELLAKTIFPATLTAMYRCCAEVEDVCGELLALGSPQRSADERAQTVQRLAFGFHSHHLSLGGEDLRRLGLPVVRDPAAEEATGLVTRQVVALIGPEARTEDGPRRDALLATRDGARVRVRPQADGPAAAWEDLS